ncbi:MAG: aspartate-semialdehyde dehydrogenase [Bacteroidia bacterium]
MKLALVGATGLVGQKMIEVLQEFNIPITQFIPVASARSAGTSVMYNNVPYTVITAEEAVALSPDVALFSAGGSVSLEWAPKFAAVGCTVIDNSSAWRMDTTKKLIVPEVNGNTLTSTDKIIANPNCSTIQLVMVLKPLHDKYKIKRVVISTYQSVTGTGVQAVAQLMDERAGLTPNKVYPHTIDLNVLPHIDVFMPNDYTKEEMKMVNETQKIIGDSSIKLTATAVRIPVMGGHSESVNIEFENNFDITEIKQLLSTCQGVTVQDDVVNNLYPMPLTSHNKNDVFVGRIRRDESQANTLNCWIVADNLRKGAATNAVQIVELLLSKGLVG